MNELNKLWELWVLVDPSVATMSHGSHNELNGLLVFLADRLHSEPTRQQEFNNGLNELLNLRKIMFLIIGTNSQDHGNINNHGNFDNLTIKLERGGLMDLARRRLLRAMI